MENDGQGKEDTTPHHRTGSILQGVDKPSCSGGARKISLAHYIFSEQKDQHFKALVLRNTKMEKQCDYSSLNQNLENRSTLNLEEKKQSRVTCEGPYYSLKRIL